MLTLIHRRIISTKGIYKEWLQSIGETVPAPLREGTRKSALLGQWEQGEAAREMSPRSVPAVSAPPREFRDLTSVLLKPSCIELLLSHAALKNFLFFSGFQNTILIFLL